MLSLLKNGTIFIITIIVLHLEYDMGSISKTFRKLEV